MTRALVAGALGLLLTLVGSAVGHEVQYSAHLTGPNEAPPNGSPGVGDALVTVDLDLVTMRVEASFTGLTGTTTASHIHGLTAQPFTGTASVATVTPTFTNFPLGVTSGTYDFTYDMTQASSYNSSFITASGGTVSQAFNALLNGLDTGRTYFNIHTSTFGAGEIRGFLVPVPEPASAATLVGAVGLTALRRRRRN